MGTPRLQPIQLKDALRFMWCNMHTKPPLPRTHVYRAYANPTTTTFSANDRQAYARALTMAKKKHTHTHGSILQLLLADALYRSILKSKYRLVIDMNIKRSLHFRTEGMHRTTTVVFVSGGGEGHESTVFNSLVRRVQRSHTPAKSDDHRFSRGRGRARCTRVMHGRTRRGP